MTFEHIIATRISMALIIESNPKERKAESARPIFPIPRLSIIPNRFPL